MKLLRLNYRTLRWLLIPAIAAHNLEEWIAFRSMRLDASGPLAKLGFTLQSPPWEVTQLALALVTVIPALIISFASFGRQHVAKDFLVCVVAGIFFTNVFLPHIPSAIVDGVYSPGIVTAIFFNLPLILLFWRRAAIEGVLSSLQIWTASILGGLLMAPSIIAVMLLADHALKF